MNPRPVQVTISREMNEAGREFRAERLTAFSCAEMEVKEEGE